MTQTAPNTPNSKVTEDAVSVSAETRLTSINSWTKSNEGTVRVYTNPQGWTIGKGPGDNGWTIRNPHGTTPRRETYQSVLAAQLRVADYMGI